MAETMAVALDKKDQVLLITFFGFSFDFDKGKPLSPKHPSWPDLHIFNQVFLCGGYYRNMPDVLFLFKTELSQHSRGANVADHQA